MEEVATFATDLFVLYVYILQLILTYFNLQSIKCGSEFWIIINSVLLPPRGRGSYSTASVDFIRFSWVANSADLEKIMANSAGLEKIILSTSKNS